jgi:hypothetical protein
MTDSESQPSTIVRCPHETLSSPATPKPSDACHTHVDTESPATEDSRHKGPLTLPLESTDSLGTKRKRTEVESCVSERPRKISLETWKGRLLGVEDDLFDAIWSLHEDDTPGGKDHLESHASLEDAITYELEHVQTMDITTLDDSFPSRRDSGVEDLEQYASSKVDRKEHEDLGEAMRFDLSPTSADAACEWLDSFTHTLDTTPPLQTCSGIALPLIESTIRIETSHPHTTHKAKLGGARSENATGRTQLIHFGIMDVPLLRI